MRSEWPRLSFAELVRNGSLEIGDGYRAKNDELGGEGLIFLRAGHVTDTHIDFSGVERFKVEGYERFGPKVSRVGDVVVTTKGNSTGRVTYVTQGMPPFVYSPHLSYWRSRDRSVVHPGFLRAWSRGAEFASQLAGLSRSTDMAPYLSLSDQRSLTITLPPSAYQEYVATLGGALEDRIDLLRQTNTTLESIAQALFKSWFVDFDPVRAKQAGREPDGMDAAVATLFPAEFEDSPMGPVPAGWSIRTIDELAARVGMGPFGSNIKVSTFVDSGVPVLSGACLAEPLLEDVDFKFITEHHAERLAGSVVHAGDIVITHRGTLGQVSLVPSGLAYPAYVLSQSQFFLRANLAATTPEFLTYFLRSPLGQHLLLANAAQVGVPSISRPVTNLRAIQLVAPSPQVARAFGDTVSLLHRRIIAGRSQRALLGRLRDTLLPRLISGKLPLPESQEQLEDALA